jgi:hypothetical protein
LHRPADRPSIHTLIFFQPVLQQSPTVRFLHPSFVDFLVTKERCVQDVWFFDRSTHHQRIALRCLDRMDIAMQENIGEDVPEDVAYACIFWIEHVCSTKHDCHSVIERINTFLFHHLLHWFEVVSYLSRFRDIPTSLNLLLDWITVSQPTSSTFFPQLKTRRRTDQLPCFPVID